MKATLVRRLQSSWLSVHVSLALALPSIVGGLFNDDYLQRLRLRGELPELTASPLELYDFIGHVPGHAKTLVGQGALPWWTAPDLQVRFFRPLSSLLLALDQRLFGDGNSGVLLAHLHSWLWFALLLVVAHRLFKELLTPLEANFATAIYALAGHHAYTSTWLAARHELVAGVFGLLAFFEYVRSDALKPRSGQWRGLLVSVAWFALALAAGEIALGAVGLIVGFEFLSEHTSRTFGQRLKRVAPHVVVAASYLVAYAAYDYGARASGGYLQLTRGAAVWLELVRRLPVLAGDALLGIPADIYLAASEARSALATLGVLACALCLVFWKIAALRLPPATRRRAWALAAGGALALLPGAPGMIGGRVLVLAGFGLAAFLGALLTGLWVELRSPAALRGVTRILLWQGFGLLGFAHFMLGPVIRIGVAASLQRVATEQAHLQEHAAFDCGAARTAFLLHAPDPTIGMYADALLRWPDNAARLPRVQVLSMAPGRHRLTRLSESSFRLEPLEMAFLKSPFEQLFRAPARRFESGDQVPIAGARVVIASVDASGQPSAIRLELSQGTEACFVLWKDGALRSLAAPAPGSSLDVKSTPGPFGM